MLLLCGLLVATLFTGAYDDAAFGFSQGAYMVFLIAFLGGMLVLFSRPPSRSSMCGWHRTCWCWPARCSSQHN